MGRRYGNAPVVEALCEFQFVPSVPWDLTFPGLVYDRLRAQFPKRRQAKTFEVDLSTEAQGVQQKVVTTDRVQFVREDEKALVQLGQDLLAVNHLRPYPTWDEFKPLIQMAFEKYCEVAEPKGIQRLAVRYINRFEFPADRLNLEDYLEFRPYLGPQLPQDIGPFVLATQVPYQGGDDVLRLRLSSAESPKAGVTALLLDLEYSTAPTSQVPLSSASEWIQAAHDRIEQVFEATVTPKLRATFGEAK